MSGIPPGPKVNSRARQILVGLVFFCVYAGAKFLALSVAFTAPFAPSILPVFGLLLGALIACRREDRGPILIGGFAGSLVFNLGHGQQAMTHGIIFYTANCAQSFLGLYLLQAREGKPFSFMRVRHVVRFGVAAFFISAVGVSIAVLSDAGPGYGPSKRWLLLWQADLAGVLTVTPLVVKLLRKVPEEEEGGVNPFKIGEGAILFTVLLVMSDFIFGNLLRAIYPDYGGEPYQIFPVLLWAAFRFGPRGAALASFAVSLFAVIGTSKGWCPAFASPNIVRRTVLLDAFLLTSSAFSMISAALMAERFSAGIKFRRLYKELDHVNQELKGEISERIGAEKMLRAILNGANACIISTDVNGGILTFNSAAQTLLGFSAEEVVGRKNLLDLHEPKEIAHRASYLSQRLGRPVSAGFEVLALVPATGEIHEVEWTYIGKDGRRVDVLVFMTALFDQDHRPTGFIAAGRDITLQKKAEAELRETQSAVHNFFENGPLMMGVVEIGEGETDIVHISDNIASAQFYGTSPEAMAHKSATALGDTPAYISYWIQQYRKSKQNRQPVKFEFELQIGEKLMHLRATVSYIAIGPTGRGRYSYVMEDITNYREAQAQMKRFAAILEATTDFVGMADRTGKTLYLNRAAQKLLGLEGKPIPQGHHIYDVHPDWASLLARREGIPVAMLEGAWQGESALLGPDRKEIPVSQVILSHRSAAGDVDFLSTILRDMSEQKLAQERIRASLGEKEALLKEIHHRVKNNMQVVSSLLQLQSRYTDDPQTKAMFEESRDRIRSMALIHEKLYQTKDLAKIEFGEYIPSLVNMIFATQNVRTGVIRSEVRVGEVSFGVDTAIPLGLVINELVSNCLKHAFKDRESGLVIIELQNHGDHGYCLVVRDNGNGLPLGFNIDSTSSLGLKLVRILAQQIGGELTVENRDGSYFQITFKEPSARE
jgi:PAS domain S-box-containing protein